MPDQEQPVQPSALAECESRMIETLRSLAPRPEVKLAHTSGPHRSEVLAAIRDYANAERRRIQGGGTTTAGAPPYDSALHAAQALLREYMRDLPAVTVERACDDLACISLDALERVLWKLQDRPAPAEAAGKRKAPVGTGMELPTADAFVRKYIVDHAGDHTVTVRELVKEIRCSAGLISMCPAWQTYMKLRKAGRAPRAVGLTDKLLEITPAARHHEAESADRDEEIDRKEALERLIREQESDQRADDGKHFVPRRKP